MPRGLRLPTSTVQGTSQTRRAQRLRDQDLGAAETSADMVTSGAARRIRAPCVAVGVTIFGAPRARRRRIPWTGARGFTLQKATVVARAGGGASFLPSFR